jgi:hypothetical protein
MKFLTDLLSPNVIGYWLPVLLLALPNWVRQRSFLSFLRAAINVFIGLAIPLYWFLMSSFMVPGWKGESTMGWLSCFALGKLWLLPLVLWGASAFYVRVIWATHQQTKTWIVLGYVGGALVSDVCLLWALLCCYQLLLQVWPFIPPIALAIYYTVTARRLLLESGLGDRAWITVAGTSVPLWALSIWQSLRTYQGLPDQRPAGCFIVTAAMHGHHSIVGEPKMVVRHGQTRQANDQLVTFWEFEDRWQTFSPGSHRAFRNLYNRIGPLIAARLKNKILADLAFIALKPLELLAAKVSR